ncbi:MAG: SoxR reducing system RseC family protein [Denitratisoma sp.]|nr:SoxR reducing system RseC family protein [Denitratisoma sp.]
MDQEAIVARVEGDHAYVEVGGGGGCGRCHETGGCQSGILGQLFSSKPRQFRIANRIGAVPGDHVVVRVADGATLRAALLTYILPVLFLLSGAVAGNHLGEAGRSEALAALGALAGLALGVLAGLTLRRARIGAAAEPVLIRRNTSSCLTKEACR